MSFRERRKKRSSSNNQQNHHPLLIRKVFARLFEYISVEDLKAVRLVTRVWHEEATCLLSSRIHGILLHDKIDWKRFLKLLSKSSSSPKLSGLNHIHPFHSFVFFSSYPEDPADTPYKTAILDYMHSKYRLPRMRAFWDEKFFTTYGHQISALKFIQFNLYTEKALREFRELLSIHTPNLESLTLQLQRDSAGSGGSAGQTTSNSTPPSTTPTPTPSPSPLAIPGNDNVFFPPNAESQMKTLANLKRFVFKTDNKYYVNPHALEEFMSLMPSLEEFTYRYTGAKKQWTLMRKVDIIDVLCSVINGGHYKSLKVMDLDSNGTVLSGEDFKKISNLCNNGGDNDESDYRPNYDSSEQSSIVLRKFSCQVFIKNEQDWSYFCAWLRRIHESLRVLDIQVRTASPQIPCESELPLCFANVANAKLILDNNLHVFLRRLPNVVTFSGIYDNELFPLQSSSASFGYEQHYEPNLEEEKEESASNKSREDESRETFFNTINEHELPSCPSAKYLRIYGNEEVMLDIEWKAGVFRNIVSLETDVYFDNDLRLVWVHLREKLTRLVIHLKGPIPEEAFTGAGLPPVNNFDEKHPMTYHDEEHLAALAEYPNMSFMAKLEVLEIQSGSRVDAYGTQFSASIIIYGVSLLPNLRRIVLPPSIPPKCLESSIRFLANLPELRYLCVCDDTFKSVLPFHALKMELPNLEIVVKYHQTDIKKIAWSAWKLERLVFPDFLPETDGGWMKASQLASKRHSTS